VRNFEPVGTAVGCSCTLMCRKDRQVASRAERLTKSKAQPKAHSHASAGNGSGQHVIAATLWHQAGTELLHLPWSLSCFASGPTRSTTGFTVSMPRRQASR